MPRYAASVRVTKGGRTYAVGEPIDLEQRQVDHLRGQGVTLEPLTKPKPAPEKAPSDDQTTAKADDAKAEAEAAEKAEPPKATRRRRRRKGTSS